MPAVWRTTFYMYLVKSQTKTLFISPWLAMLPYQPKGKLLGLVESYWESHIIESGLEGTSRGHLLHLSAPRQHLLYLYYF